MRLTPLDIQQQKFKKAFRGFDMKEVDAFLELVKRHYEELILENRKLKEEAREQSRRIEEYRERERTLKETMITAQKIVEDIKSAARKEADVVVSQAEIQAEKILRGAQDRLVGVLEDIRELKRQRAQLWSNMKGILDSHSKLLEVQARAEEEEDKPEEGLKVFGEHKNR
ncbi:MAG: DivIVA domain-containing protein [Deltaproteobacteria bacterium]|nr:DivIVA domain-containing protein [Deltaproteobacteria bacterium]